GGVLFAQSLRLVEAVERLARAVEIVAEGDAKALACRLFAHRGERRLDAHARLRSVAEDTRRGRPQVGVRLRVLEDRPEVLGVERVAAVARAGGQHLPRHVEALEPVSRVLSVATQHLDAAG